MEKNTARKIVIYTALAMIVICIYFHRFDLLGMMIAGLYVGAAILTFDE